MLFGGRDQNSELGDTWEWDGAAWRQVVTATAPAARQDHQQAYDVAAGRTIVFAGTDAAGPIADMWSFDGQRWTQLAPAHLPAIPLIGCEYDARRGALVAMQATTLWTWNGFDWQSSPLPTSLVPPSESRSTLLFDEHRMRLVAFDEHPPYDGGDRLYIETPTPAGVSDYGTDCAPTGIAVPRLFTIGRPALRDGTFGLGARVAQPGQPIWIGLGLASQTIPLAGGCTLLVDQFVDIRLLPSGANGFADTNVPVPDDLYLRQLDVYAQALTITAAGTAVTRGLHLVVGD